MKSVLITNAAPDSALAPLDGIARVVKGPVGGAIMARADVLRVAPGLDGIINQAELKVDAELLDAAPRLKIVANVAIGVDNLDLELMAERGVWATNTPDAFVASTADCTLGLMLALLRKIPQADRYVRSSQWRADGFQPGVWDGVLLAGKTLGVIGYGAIGQAVARRARAFDMRVIYHHPRPASDPEWRSLDALLAQADVVSLHTPLTPRTRHLINAARLARMKSTSVLINMARGAVAREADVVEALRSGAIAGAALDVFEFEPEVHPALLALDNVVLTPHLGGGTRQSRHAARFLCARNVAEVLRGNKPVTPVNAPRL